MQIIKLSQSLSFCALVACTAASNVRAADDYKPGSDSSRQQGVPQGEVTKFSWRDSKIFPGTWRDWWIYVPQQYDAAKPPCVMIFCDGEVMIREKIGYRVPTVFDNLIAKKEMPVTIGVFINPGDNPDAPAGQQHNANRSVEYDSLGDTYARFLLEEIMPQVSKKYHLTKDPAGWAICGNSSGGICAFTAAWERPETFGKVVSHIGSFVNIRGGDVYPSLIRKTKEDAAPDASREEKAKLAQRRKIRVFLQDGSNDINNSAGNWPLANQEMAAALKFAGWDYKFVFGTGAHDHMHAAAIFPDAMRWLWRDHTDRTK